MAAGALALGAWVASGDDDPVRRDVVLEVWGSPRPDWRPDVAACVDPAWEPRITPDPAATPAGVRVLFDPVHYDEQRTFEALLCLRARPGVTYVNKPGYDLKG